MTRHRPRVRGAAPAADASEADRLAETRGANPSSPPRAKEERPIAVYGALIANAGIAMAKFIAAAITGSSAMISEGIHSMVDTADQGLLLLGIRRSRRPADEAHPFGHGKELYFWGLIVAIVIFGVGGGVSIYEGITHILDPVPLRDPLVNYIVLGIALVLEGSSWTIAAREVRKASGRAGVVATMRASKDPSVVTVLMEDSAAVIGLLIAGLGIFVAHETGDARIDGVASLAIGIILALVAVFLAAESRGLLIGEGADPDLILRLREVAESDRAIERVERVRSMHLGPEHVVITMRVRYAGGDGDGVARAIDRLAGRLKALDARLADVTIQPSLTTGRETVGDRHAGREPLGSADPGHDEDP